MLCTNFNSIKVRLERYEDITVIINAESFQFHKGTIRTSVCFFFCVVINYFNSIKVRLERIALNGHYLLYAISIP